MVIRQGFFKAIKLYYQSQGLLGTFRRSIEVSGDYASKLVMEIIMKFSGDVFFERYFLQDRGVLSHMKNAKGLRIAISRVGGLGDALTTTAMVTAIKEKWPEAHIYLFVRNESQRKFLAKERNINKVVVVTQKVDLSAFLKEKMAQYLTKKHIDIFFLHRYVVRASFRKGVLPDLKKELDKLFQQFNVNFYIFPYFNNSLLVFKKNEYELSSACTDLRIEPSGLSLTLDAGDYKILDGLPEAYITVHHGADSESVSPLRKEGNLQTKNWFTERWAEVAAFAKSRGYEVVQLGIPSDHYIPGTIDMRGKTRSMTEAGAILKKAALHLDTEGGLVHFAKAVGTKSLVLFGPTAIEFYGYRDNINIRTGDCRNCWGSKPDWQYECAAGHEVPVCMDAIDVEMVTKALEDFLRSRKKSS